MTERVTELREKVKMLSVDQKVREKVDGLKERELLYRMLEFSIET
jgi:hypothetical protein